MILTSAKKIVRDVLWPVFVIRNRLILSKNAKTAQSHYLDLLNRLRNEKKDCMSFGVYVVFDSTYAVDGVFRSMISSNNWDPKIVVVPDVSRGEEHKIRTYRATKEFFVSKYGEEFVIDGWNKQTDEYYDHLNMFDVVCYANPYDSMVNEKHGIQYASNKSVLPIYVSYGYDVGRRTTLERLRGPELNLVWKCFADTTYSYEDYKRYQLIKGKNVVLSGYAKMDLLANYKDVSDRKKRILIAAHHTVASKILPLSNFVKYSDLLLELPGRFPDIEFVFRPHPLLFTAMANNGIWSEKEVDEYIKDLQKNGIVYSSGGDYLGIFMQCDAIINDCGSFTIEWLYTGKPGCFVYNENLKENDLTRLMNTAIADYSIARSAEDILLFIEKINKGDYEYNGDMKKWVKENVALNYPGVSDFILDEINILDKKEQEK